MYKKYLKRVIDFIISLFALLLLSPILLIFTLIGLVVMKGNPFFTQKRPGKNGKIFKLIKFRTMTCKKNENGNLLPDEQRLTKYGRFLRSTSIDELPELINILIGDMAIIGPRPLLVEYLPYYSEVENRRHEILPGLTGWAQVNGRNVTGWDVRLAQDVYYVDNCSFALDCKIVLMTITKVLKRSDILVGEQHGAGHGRLDVVRKEAAKKEAVNK